MLDSGSPWGLQIRGDSAPSEANASPAGFLEELFHRPGVQGTCGPGRHQLTLCPLLVLPASHISRFHFIFFHTSNASITQIKQHLRRRSNEAVSLSLPQMGSKASFCHLAPEHQQANPSTPKDSNRNRQQDIKGWSGTWALTTRHNAHFNGHG